MSLYFYNPILNLYTRSRELTPFNEPANSDHPPLHVAENGDINTVIEACNSAIPPNSEAGEINQPPTITQKPVRRRRKRQRLTLPPRSSKRQKAKAVIHRQSTPPPPSHTAVVYEQQSWEGAIVNEREINGGCGRPCKQYLVQWKSSWIDSNRLNEPHLLQSWKARAST